MARVAPPAGWQRDFSAYEIGGFNMGGKGPAPKPAQIRQRANKKSTKATLPADGQQGNAPELPPVREYHPLTLQWWEKVWASPMASEFLETDADGLARVALLIDAYYVLISDPDAVLTSGKAKELMSEIRLQEARFGLSPVDRSRLQWEVAKGEEAQSKRQAAKQPRPSAKNSSDPRGILGVVN